MTVSVEPAVFFYQFDSRTILLLNIGIWYIWQFDICNVTSSGIVNSTSWRTFTNVPQVTGCSPSPANHRLKISILICSASFKCLWITVSILDPVSSEAEHQTGTDLLRNVYPSASPSKSNQLCHSGTLIYIQGQWLETIMNELSTNILPVAEQSCRWVESTSSKDGLRAKTVCWCVKVWKL